jgi:hypothetical protein
VPHDLNIPVDKNRTEQYITEHFGQTKHYDFYAASAQPDENVPFVSNTTELSLSLMAASTISGAPNLSSKRSQILATPHVGSELNEDLIVFACLPEYPQYTVLLSYFNSSSGVLPIINKLPYNIQEKWTMRAANYKKQQCAIPTILVGS